MYVIPSQRYYDTIGMDPSMNRLLLKIKYSFYCAMVFFLFANPETAAVLQQYTGYYSPLYGLFIHTGLFFITVLGLMLLPSE
jgi:hypothetical protein